MNHCEVAVTDPEFYDPAYYARMDLRYVNNIHSGRFRAMANVLSLLKDKRILDIGCGGGWVSGLYWKVTKKLTAIDFAPAAIDFARRHYPGPDFKTMSVFELNKNFKEGEFEVVVANDVIEHTYDHGAFLENCRFVLNANGALIIGTDLDDVSWTHSRVLRLLRAFLLPWGVDGLRFLMLRILEYPLDKVKNYHDSHVHMLSQDDLLQALEEHGFVVEKILKYNLTHGFIRDFVLGVLRIMTRLELRDHQLIVARKVSRS